MRVFSFHTERTTVFKVDAVYLEKIRVYGEDFDIPVHVGQEFSKVLLNRQSLKNQQLVVDIPSKVLTLG
ncbi:hypothetical protein [Nostoc sp.]|uniref:hypothetical protein n=1 Tax=Nostoc sp. TaxID=1180 RepID=UPI002FF77327